MQNTLPISAYSNVLRFNTPPPLATPTTGGSNDGKGSRLVLDAPTAPPVHLELGRQFGAGGFGDVYYGKLQNELVAIKRLSNVAPNPADNRRKAAAKEATALRRLDHPGVVKLRGFYEMGNCSIIAMQLGLGGDLFDACAGKPMREVRARSLFTQVLEAVQHCHAQGVFHRDIKAENFVFADTLQTHLMLIDFGISKIVPPDRTRLLNKRVGTPKYAAPELHQLGARYDGKKVDAWACGHVLYNMLTGRDLAGADTARLQDHHREEPIRPKAWNLLQHLLAITPAKRLTVSEARMHPWFFAASVGLTGP